MSLSYDFVCATMYVCVCVHVSVDMYVFRSVCAYVCIYEWCVCLPCIHVGGFLCEPCVFCKRVYIYMYPNRTGLHSDPSVANRTTI